MTKHRMAAALLLSGALALSFWLGEHRAKEGDPYTRALEHQRELNPGAPDWVLRAADHKPHALERLAGRNGRLWLEPDEQILWASDCAEGRELASHIPDDGWQLNCR